MSNDYYTPKQIQEFFDAAKDTEKKRQALSAAFIAHEFKSRRAREFAVHGFCRRFNTLHRCIEKVFETLPPDLTGIPQRDALLDTAIVIQTFILNTFGSLDNLAWTWVKEKKITRQNGKSLSFGEIGLSEKCSEVRKSLPEKFRELLKMRKEWFETMESYRHAIAHRIPLYVPPAAVLPENEQKYLELGKASYEASLRGDRAARIRIEAEREKLEFFRPLIVHSFSETSPLLVIHPQILADYHTIEEFAWQMHASLNAGELGSE